jgi:hypothetical protein
MIEKKYVVAKNDYVVSHLMKKIYSGRVSDYDKILLRSQNDAVRKIQRYPYGIQELYSIYEVKFDRNEIVKR